MEIIKGNGTRVEYDEERVRANIRRTGASSEIAQKVLDDIRSKVFEGMHTSALHELVKKSLQQHSVCHACRYNLRDALLRLGPAGFNFEFFIAELLGAHGYDARVPTAELRGACVEHEVDVVAHKENRSVFIEAKFRNVKDDVVNLKDVMATWARFLDLVDGAGLGYTEHLDECMIMTNARFTDVASRFGTCKGMRLVSWDYPKGFTLASLIDQTALYPVTVIDDFSPEEIGKMAEAGILLCKNLEALEPDELSSKIQVSIARAQSMVHAAGLVVHGE